MSNQKKNGGNTVEIVTRMAQPVAEEFGVRIWNVKFVKEGASWFLQILVDKPDGTLTVEDCENVNRAMGKALDQNDPIEQSYYLEVSSPGLYRELVKPWHFEEYLQNPVDVKLIRPDETGQREFTGTLTAFDKNKIITVMTQDGEKNFPFQSAASVRLHDDFEESGVENE